MTLYQIKPLFQTLLRPTMFWLYKHHVTANHINLAALALSLITGLLLMLVAQPILFLLLPIVLFIRFAASDSQVGLDEVVVIAQSVGAVLVATWVHDYAPAIRGLVLASPAFKVKLYVPLARPVLALWHHLRGLFFINSYVKGHYLTHDRQRVASFNNDPLITRAIAVNILLDLYKTSERIVSDAAAITLPTQLLISGDDYVVHRQPQIDFYQRLRSPLKELHLLPGFYHDTLGKENRAQAFEKMQSFISRLYANKSQKFDYQHEDRTGPSADRWRLLLVDPCHYRRLIWRIALCVRR